MNSERRGQALLLIGAMLLGWIVVGGFVVPSLIESAYAGQSWAVLNAQIRGSDVHALDFYLTKWAWVFWPLTTILVLLLAAVRFLPTRFVTRETLGATWQRYWFSPKPLGYLGITRIVCVGTQLWLLLFFSPYTLDRLRQVAALPGALYDPLPALRVFLAPWGGERPSLLIVSLVYWATITAGSAAFIGYNTNFALFLFAAGCTFLQAFCYSFGDLHHPEALLIITFWILAFSPAGASLSCDSLRRTGARFNHMLVGAREKSAFAAWPLLLVQALFAVTYLDAAVKKLQSAGLEWMNGYTLQYYLYSDALRRDFDFGVWLAQQHTLAWTLSWISILFEATFWLIIFFPRLAWIYVPLGAAFHLGNAVTGVATFYQYIALYVVFLPNFLGAGIRSPLAVWRQPNRELHSNREYNDRSPESNTFPSHGVVLFDGECNFCNGWMRFIFARDPKGKFRFAALQSEPARSLIEQRCPNVAAMDSIILLTPTHVHNKSAAAIHILRELGVPWSFATVFLSIPARWRDIVYDYVASNRYRWFGKRDYCGLPSPEMRRRVLSEE